MIVGIICGLWFQTEHYFPDSISYVFLGVFFFLYIAWYVFFNKLESIVKLFLKYIVLVFYARVSISAAIGIIIMVSYITYR